MHDGLAFVFAHPDDETFSVAGTMAAYARRGIRCDLFCATNGDAGRSSGVPVSSRDELGALRRNELIAAARLLGVRALEMPGHHDGRLGSEDADVLVGEIVAFLRRTRPRVVVTFGPEGGPNHHRDHRAICRAATAAFFLAGVATEYPEQAEAGLTPHRAERLFYVAWPPLETLDPDMRWRSLPVTARLDVRADEGVKVAAFQAHVTQHTLADRFRRSALRDDESYALAAGVPQPRALIEDLLEGL